MSYARLLRRRHVEPLREDAPIAEIISYMAAVVEENGYLDHLTAGCMIAVRFGHDYTVREPILQKNGEPLRGSDGKILNHKFLHPEILRAFKRATSDTVVWERNARAWRKHKSPPPVSTK